MAIFKIPFSNKNQKFTITISGVNYTVTAYFNNQMQAWIVDMINTTTEESIIIGLPFVTGGDLLEQYHYTGLIGMLVAYTNGEPAAIPTYSNLGDGSNIYYIT